MGSREKDQTTPHQQPLLSSLVVRPSNSEGGGGGGGGGGRGSDYEPGEVRREPPSYSRSNRYSDDAGYRLRAGSGSPIRRRADHRFSSDFDHSAGLPRSREFGSGRDPGRYQDSSPHFTRGRGGGRPFGRGIDGPEFVPGSLRGEGLSRNNPNVRPREGDWICSDPLCANLNFARREYCNNCNRHRYGSGGSPRRTYPGPPLPNAPPRRLPGPPMDRSPGRGRTINGFRSPPRGWVRDGPREFGSGGVPPAARHENRLPDHHFRRERLDFADDHHRGRTKIERPMPVDWGHRERKAFERRPPSPPAPPPLPPPNRGGRWGRDARGRSRSPIRGGPPPKDYHRDVYMHQRGRDDRRGMGRDRIGGAY